MHGRGVFPSVRHLRLLALVVLGAAAIPAIADVGPAHAAKEGTKRKPAGKVSAAVTAAQQYAEAVGAGNKVAAGRLDFACQYRMATSSAKSLTAFPADTDPIYSDCWTRLEQVHTTVVQQRDTGMDAVWPGKGALVFFSEDLNRYAPSLFVMDRLGTTPPGSGFKVEVVDAAPLPAASFRLRENGATLAAPATRVRLRITYKDPLTSPITYAQGAYKWTNTVKRPRQALKTVTLNWIVMTGLKKLGFAGDAAVLNMPVLAGTELGGPIPFVTETGGADPKSAGWWKAEDAPGLMIASVGRASQFPELRDRVGMLNRVLIIDPHQPDALTLLTRDLYNALLNASAALHQVPVLEPLLAARFNQLYWDTYAQTTRMEISLGMEMGGVAKPTPADYLYRMIPAMEKLAQVRPEDLENRLRLGIVTRWNNDQLAAIAIHDALVKDLPPKRAALRARALIELAWSRIARIAWNRTFDDPGIAVAYREAEEAFTLTNRPVDKFAAAYTMAYSLAFTPNRDNHAMLQHLTEAHRWYMQLGGASPDSWRYLLANDTLKGVVEADPSFEPLLAAS